VTGGQTKTKGVVMKYSISNIVPYI